MVMRYAVSPKVLYCEVPSSLGTKGLFPCSHSSESSGSLLQPTTTDERSKSKTYLQFLPRKEDENRVKPRNNERARSSEVRRRKMNVNREQKRVNAKKYYFTRTFTIAFFTWPSPTSGAWASPGKKIAISPPLSVT